jgi:quinoprotein glucose dehydrogenase
VRKWHFQFVHHPIWNMDNTSAPLLMDINVDGKLIKAVASPSRNAWLYVLDRVTGQPVWPIEERPVPQSDVPGEKTSPTQPHPTKPPAYARNYLKVPDDLIDFTPEMRAEALEKLKRYKWAPSPFTPPVVGDPNGILGAIGNGAGSNWPGGGFDPETNTVYVQASNIIGGGGSLRIPPPGFTDLRYIGGIAGGRFTGPSKAYGYGQNPDAAPGTARPGDRAGRGGAEPEAAPTSAAASPSPAPGGGGFNVQGLPMVKPPYGVLTAVDLNRGDILWQVPHGDTPDSVRNHPRLRGMNIPKTGQPEATHSGGVGLVVTKTLVILGDGMVTGPPGRPRGAMLRAYNKATGEQVGEVWMPAQQSGSPMTYMVNGRQYIVVAISGGTHSAEYLAFRLPS